MIPSPDPFAARSALSWNRDRLRLDGLCLHGRAAAMNDLQSPALYNAWHEIAPVERRESMVEAADIVGPVCEAGAYGSSMSSTYNTHPLAVEAPALNDRGEWSVARKRQSVEMLWECEAIPAAS